MTTLLKTRTSLLLFFFKCILRKTKSMCSHLALKLMVEEEFVLKITIFFIKRM